MEANRKAFLDMIAVSEGTKGNGDDGYNVIVGGSLFHDYSDHPRIRVNLGRKLVSTAAGRYQFLYRTWFALQRYLELPDFSPDSQDKAAIQLIKEQKALNDVDAGRFEVAVHKCRNIWASLPGAGYGQHENRMDALITAYTGAGGKLA